MTLKLAQEEITLAASAHRQEASHSDGYPRIIQTQLPLAALPELAPCFSGRTSLSMPYLVSTEDGHHPLIRNLPSGKTPEQR